MDVELGRRSDVSFLYGSSHHHDPTYLLLYLRKTHQKQTQVRQRTNVYPSQLPFVLHYSFVYLRETVGSERLFWGFYDRHSPEAILSVHYFCCFELSLNLSV